MARDKDITLLALAKKSVPYDPSVADQEHFLDLVRRNEEFEKQFQEKVTDEFLKKVRREGKCYFAINNVSYKQIKGEFKEQLRVGYCGMDNKPLLSIDM